MTQYAVEVARVARKQILAIRDATLRVRIERAILALADVPRPPGVKKLSGREDHWRLRIGDWRVVYRIDDGRLVVLVVAVAARGGVYETLR